jgi:hypothetical protein
MSLYRISSEYGYMNEGAADNIQAAIDNFKKSAAEFLNKVKQGESAKEEENKFKAAFNKVKTFISGEDPTYLQKVKMSLEIKIKELDKQANSINIKSEKFGPAVKNSLKLALIKIKQLFTQLIKLIATALVSAENKYKSFRKDK